MTGGQNSSQGLARAVRMSSMKNSMMSRVNKIVEAARNKNKPKTDADISALEQAMFKRKRKNQKRLYENIGNVVSCLKTTDGLIANVDKGNLSDEPDHILPSTEEYDTVVDNTEDIPA